MIKLRLKFADDQATEFEINDGELLSDAMNRALESVPLNGRKKHQVFNATVNGKLIEGDFWKFTAIKKQDEVVISPRIEGDDGGQIFKTIAIIAITVVASYLLTPAGGATIASSLAVAGVTIGASLLLNALIPPPVPKIGDLAFGGSMESSQMYSIDGQSNQVRRMQTVPKVYGTHRMFPIVAATPYTELAVSTGSAARNIIADLMFAAKAIGSSGNNIQIIYQTGGTAGSETVSVSGNTITITYEGGVSTAQQIKTKVEATGSASALVNVTIIGTGSNAQSASDSGTTRLYGGSDAGETIQYLYAIYDFGMGTHIVDGLKIGDTDLTTDSFQDFKINFVDPAKPVIPADVYDESLKSTFQYYKGRREIQPLSLGLNDPDDQSVQNSDVNADNLVPEIILDFVCPAGLYGFSSGGTLGQRNILLEIQFATVGTSDWRDFNDLTYVDSHQVVGGKEITEFAAPVIPTISTQGAFDAYYYGTFAMGFAFGGASVYIKAGTNKLLLGNNIYDIGAKVFYGNRFIGYVQSIDTVTHAPNIEVTVDRVITTSNADLLAYQYWGGTSRNISSFRVVSQDSGAAIISGQNTSAVYGSIRFTPKSPGQYQVRVRRVRAYGTYSTSTGDQLTWGGLTTAYVAAPIVTNKRHTFMEIKIRATDQLNGNISTLSGVVQSVLDVYDPITETWTRQPTRNPAWIFADFLTGEVNKKAVAKSRLHMDSLVEWADFCDEVPTPPPAQTFTDPRFTCNFVLDYTTTLQDILGQVANAAQASLNIIDGKYGVLIDRFRSTPIQIFTPRNSKNFSSMIGYGPLPDGVKISFIDPNTGWEVNEVGAYDNGFDGTNAINLDSLTAFACTSHEQAWRFGRYMVAQNRLRRETISLTVDFEFLACTRGDFVQVTQDVMEVGGTPCRVKDVSGSDIATDDSMDIDPLLSYGYVYRGADGTIATSTLTATSPNTFTLAGGIPAVGDLIVIGVVGEIVFDCIVKAISPNDDMSAILTLVEKADAVYDYESTDQLPDYDPQISVSSLPDVRPPNVVQNLTINDLAWRCSPLKSGLDYFVDLAWDMPIGSVFELFEIWVNDGRGYVAVDTTKQKFYRYYVNQDRLDIEHGFKVAAVSATGKKLQLVAMATVTDTPLSKTTPPSDVSNFTMQITNQVLQLAWSAISDCDTTAYIIRYSPATNAVWESSIPLATVNGDVTSISVQARTGTYFIKALDSAGNESTNAAETITTIPNLFDLNDIASVNDAPTFAGEFDQTEELGEAVILSEQVHGDATAVVYYAVGYYTFANLIDLDDVYSVRLQSLIQADGLKKGELMHDWVHLSDVEHLNSTLVSDWNVALEYRASNEFSSMHDWAQLGFIDHINQGAGVGFTDWRDIPTTGDATGRIFQFRVRMESLTANVTPRVFDTLVDAFMPDRQESFDNETSSALDGTFITYGVAFAGPGTTPVVQISIDNAATGDYWSFDSKTLEGFSIRFFDKTDTQVVRQFDAVAKGFGHQHTTSL